MPSEVTSLDDYRERPAAEALRDGQVSWNDVLSPAALPVYSKLRVSDVISVYLAGRCHTQPALLTRNLGIAPPARIFDLTPPQRFKLREIFTYT